MGSNLGPGSSFVSPDVPQHNNRDSITGPAPVRVRKLVRNLPPKVVFRKIHEAERMAAAGERELGFYLLEVQRRKLYRHKGSTSFEQCLLLRSGTPARKANELMGISRKLEKLPAIDNAFADGLLYWTAVRAIVTVATPEDEHEWVEFAQKNTVRAVEKEVASCRRGDGPGKRRWGGSSVRFPHRINATPELHQLIVSWQEVLSKRLERAVTEEEALEHGLQTAMKVEIQADDDDAREGKVRKLPSGYRLVIHETFGAGSRGVPGEEGQFWVSLPDGPVRIEAATARRLLEGAEVLDLRSGTGPEGLGAVRQGGESEIDVCQKHPHVGEIASQVVSPEGAIFGVPSLPLWAKAAPLVPTDPGMRIEHAPNLTIPGGPTVPPEERAPRSSAELIKQVLSREGYFCAIPGCTNMAEIAHHIVFHSQGGPTNLLFLIAVCKVCHDAGIHKGYLLVSGTAGNLIVSAREGLPLTAGAEAYPPSVTLEVEPPPCCSEPSGPNLASEADRAADAPALVIPPEISQAWLLEHRRHFVWSERQKALVLRSDRDPVGELAGFEDPLPAPLAAAEGLDDFIGQAAAVNNLKTVLSAAKLRGDVPPPVLLAGPPGLGKTKLANLAARELGTRLYVSAGPALADILALLRLLVSLRRGDVLFIDEIHALPTLMAECFYQALDELTFSIPFIAGSETRMVKLRIEPFCLIGATTEEAQLPRPFRSRFPLRRRLDLYSTGELATIAMARGKALGVEVTPEAAENLAGASRGTPRELLAMVSLARDEAQVAAGRPDGVVITAEFAEKALRSRGIDRFGLLEIERKILLQLHEKGGRLSLRTLADLLGECPQTLLEVHEPYLLRAGWIIRTHRGRVLTERARQVVASGLDSGRKTG